MPDHTLIDFSSELSHGNSHAHTDLPVVLFGKAGGAITPGRHIRRDDERSFGDDGDAQIDLG